MNNRIIKIITSEGISPSKFGDKIGVTRSSISHILSGRNNPSLDVITKILINFKNINPEWLILGKEPMYKTTFQHTLFENTESLNKNNVEKSTKEKEKIENKDVEKINIAEEPQPKLNTKPEHNTDRKVEKIVTFYTDKTFEEYFPVK